MGLAGVRLVAGWGRSWAGVRGGQRRACVLQSVLGAYVHKMRGGGKTDGLAAKRFNEAVKGPENDHTRETSGRTGGHTSRVGSETEVADAATGSRVGTGERSGRAPGGGQAQAAEGSYRVPTVGELEAKYPAEGSDQVPRVENAEAAGNSEAKNPAEGNERVPRVEQAGRVGTRNDRALASPRVEKADPRATSSGRGRGTREWVSPGFYEATERAGGDRAWVARTQELLDGLLRDGYDVGQKTLCAVAQNAPSYRAARVVVDRRSPRFTSDRLYVALFRKCLQSQEYEALESLWAEMSRAFHGGSGADAEQSRENDQSNESRSNTSGASPRSLLGRPGGDRTQEERTHGGEPTDGASRESAPNSGVRASSDASFDTRRAEAAKAREYTVYMALAEHFAVHRRTNELERLIELVRRKTRQQVPPRAFACYVSSASSFQDFRATLQKGHVWRVRDQAIALAAIRASIRLRDPRCIPLIRWILEGTYALPSTAAWWLNSPEDAPREVPPETNEDAARLILQDLQACSAMRPTVALWPTAWCAFVHNLALLGDLAAARDVLSSRVLQRKLALDVAARKHVVFAAAHALRILRRRSREPEHFRFWKNAGGVAAGDSLSLQKIFRSLLSATESSLPPAPIESGVAPLSTLTDRLPSL
eukprot:gene16313-24996_t